MGAWYTEIATPAHDGRVGLEREETLVVGPWLAATWPAAKCSEVLRMAEAAVFKSKMMDVVNKIHAAPTTRDILVGLKDEIQSLFSAERMTIYALDTQKQELYSITATGGE